MLHTWQALLHPLRYPTAAAFLSSICRAKFAEGSVTTRSTSPMTIIASLPQTHPAICLSPRVEHAASQSRRTEDSDAVGCFAYVGFRYGSKQLDFSAAVLAPSRQTPPREQSRCSRISGPAISLQVYLPWLKHEKRKSTPGKGSQSFVHLSLVLEPSLFSARNTLGSSLVVCKFVGATRADQHHLDGALGIRPSAVEDHSLARPEQYSILGCQARNETESLFGSQGKP